MGRKSLLGATQAAVITSGILSVQPEKFSAVFGSKVFCIVVLRAVQPACLGLPDWVLIRTVMSVCVAGDNMFGCVLELFVSFFFLPCACPPLLRVGERDCGCDCVCCAAFCRCAQNADVSRCSTAPLIQLTSLSSLPLPSSFPLLWHLLSHSYFFSFYLLPLALCWLSSAPFILCSSVFPLSHAFSSSLFLLSSASSFQVCFQSDYCACVCKCV